MTQSSFCTDVFRAYYGQPERYRQVEEPQPETPPRLLSSGSKDRPYIKMLYPDGRRIEYLFGDHVNMLGALNHRRNGGRLAKFLEDAHDTGIVAHKTDLGTGRKMLSNRQKAEWEREMAKPEPPAPDWETNPSIPEPGMEGKFTADAQPMDKYAVKKPRSIFDSLPDLSDPGREQYAGKVNLHKDLPLFDKPALSGPTQTASKPPATSQKTLLNTGDYLPDMSPTATASNPPVTAQRSLVAGGESIALPPTKAPETVTKTIKGRSLSDERRAKKIIDDAGTLFHIHNQDIHGLPPDAAVKLVKYLVHEGRLFRLSHVDHPQHGKFIHVEHGIESDVPHEGRGILTELRAASPEAHLAMGRYLPKDHPIVKLASDMLNELKDEKTGKPLGMYGPKDVTKTTKTGVKRAIGAGIDPELARKRASFLANAVSQKKGERRELKMAPPSATPPTEGRTPTIGGHASETVHPQLPIATGQVVTPSQQLNPKTRRFGAFSLSASTKQFADAVVEKYTQVCREHDLLQRFAAAYYGEVERYGGQQAGHHIDFEGFNNGIPAATMMQPMKLQSAVGSGPPRHGRGSGAKAGTFAPNPLSGENKYATSKSRTPAPGQGSLFEAPTSPDLPKPEHNVPFGATSTTAPSGKDWHVKALDEIGLAPAKAKTKTVSTPAPAVSPLDAMFKPPRNLKKMSDAELVSLHHQRDEAATNRLFKSIRGGVEYMMRKFPKYRDEIQEMIGSIEDAEGNPDKGTFQIALDTYDPNKLGQDGKPASFATHHRNVLYNYVRNRPERKQVRESTIIGGKGRGEYAGDEETSLKEEPRSREASPAEALLAQGEPSGRQQKQEALDRESFLVDDEISKMSPSDQWLIEAHRGGLSPQDIASVLQSVPGSEQMDYMSTHVNKKLRPISNDAFRSKVTGVVGKPTPENIQMQIDRIVGTLRADPTFAKIRQRREDPRDAAERFADDVMRALTSPPPPKTPKIPKSLATKGKRKVRSVPGQTTMQFQLESKNALTAPAEQLQFIPDRPTGHPAPPKQPPLEGNERWALHTGESSDINELKRLNAVATKRGLIFKIKVPPASPFGKQQMESIRWFTFTPAKWKERFTQRGNPEKYGLVLSTGPRKTYGGTKSPSVQKAPSGGSGALGAFVAGLVGGRRGGTGLARAFAPPKSAAQPAAPKAPPKPRALTAAEADRLGNEMSQQQISDARARSRVTETPGGMWWINYPDLSTEANEGKKAAVKPPKAGKAAAQVKSPEDAAREEQTRRDNAIAKSLRAKQSRERAEAIERGEVPQGRGRRSGSRKSQAEDIEAGPVKSAIEFRDIPADQYTPHTKAVGPRADATMTLPGMGKIPGYWAIFELGDLTPSHVVTPDDRIVPNPKYPKDQYDESEQPRDYGPLTQNAKDVFDWEKEGQMSYWALPHPDPTNGPSSVTPRGVVTNGNKRHMIAQLAAAHGRYGKFIDAYKQNAEMFGHKPEDFDGYEHPYLVRVTPGVQEGTPLSRMLAAGGNKPTTREENEVRQAASLAREIIDDNELIRMESEMSADDTLSDVLSRKSSGFVKRLISVIEQRAPHLVNRWFDPTTNTLTPSGELAVQNMGLAKFITTPVLERVTRIRSLKNALGSAVPSIAKTGTAIKPVLESALKYIVAKPNVKTLTDFERDLTDSKRAFFRESNDDNAELAKELLRGLYMTKSSGGHFNPKYVRLMFGELGRLAHEQRLASEKNTTLPPPDESFINAALPRVRQVVQDEMERDAEIKKAELEARQRLAKPSRGLFTHRHHDATRDLYTAVHAAYYHKTTFPPHRVARKNSAPKRSKVH